MNDINEKLKSAFNQLSVEGKLYLLAVTEALLFANNTFRNDIQQDKYRYIGQQSEPDSINR